MEDSVKNLTNGVNTNNENGNASKSGSEFETTKKTKKKKDFDKVLEKAKRVYNAQINKDIETLRKSLQYVIVLFDEKGYSEAKFKSEFVKRVASILDSKSYCSLCHQMGLNSYNIATHIAMLGMKKRREVMENGFKPIQKDISEMLKPVYELEELRKYDTLGLLANVSAEESQMV